MVALALAWHRQEANGAQSLSTLYSFGFPATAAANPCAELIADPNGVLYGTTSGGGAAGQGAVFRMNQDGSGFALLHSFGVSNNDGTVPAAAMIQATNGMFYGTTSTGGAYGFGTVFQLSADGSAYSTLYSFSEGDGAYPEGRLLSASDGLLYGTTSGGGTNDYGTVFRIGADGSGFLLLDFFEGTNGANPEGGLIEASDGMLYGTTYSGGVTNAGTVFRLNKDGTGLATVFGGFGTNSFSARITNGVGPIGGVVEGTNGALYGITSGGGASQVGTIYTVNKDGTGYALLRNFVWQSNDAQTPSSGLILASDGMLYGTASDGGTNQCGAIFRIGQNGSNYAEVASLALAQQPEASLLETANGTLVGTSELGGNSGAGTVFALQKDGSGLGVVLNFQASGGDGQSPYGRLTLASDGAFYGTTRLGGSQGSGSIFSLLFYGQGYRVVTSLNASNFGPFSPLSFVLEGTNGALYGDTQYGGGGSNGTFFAVNKDGSAFGILYSPPFSPAPGVGAPIPISNTGQEPRAGLLLGDDGALYGTMTMGGNSRQGTLFRLNIDGTGYTNLQQFASSTTGPGANPTQPLIEGRDHSLYGTTYAGGASNNGTVFKVNKDGTSYSILKAFNGPPDGANPMSPLLLASDGQLYGTTYAGGASNNAGTIFRISTNGTGYQVLRSFTGTNGDPRLPSGTLVERSDGLLYGTTERGGLNDQGALFTLAKNGSSYALLASFGGSVGQCPRGGFVVGPDGALYGTTDQGGAMGFGAVFRYGQALELITSLQMSVGAVNLNCLGIPGTNYMVERNLQLAPSSSWQVLYTTNAPANGIFSVIDQSPPAVAAFYRLAR